MRKIYYERYVGFESDEIKFIPSYAEHISYAKRISYCVAIFHSFRQERISLKKARRSVRMRRRHFTMRTSLHAPKVRFMCRKAHLVLKPAGCRIAVICGRCISAYVVVCGRCIVHRLCLTTCKLPCLATLCDRIRHPCLFVNALCAHFQASLPSRLCGFSHPTAHKKRRPYSLGTVSLKISTIAEGASRCVASLHAPKVRFMCRKAHLVLKPAGCRIAVVWVAASCSDFVRPPSCILARPASCGFSHPTAHKKRRPYPKGTVFAFWCRWRGSNPHGIATNGF